jgi:hypothetical protein
MSSKLLSTAFAHQDGRSSTQNFVHEMLQNTGIQELGTIGLARRSDPKISRAEYALPCLPEYRLTDLDLREASSIKPKLSIFRHGCVLYATRGWLR